MAKQHLVPITNGKGEKELLSGNYDVTANVLGYSNASISPKNVNVLDNVTEYNFTIAATGKLTIHVSDDGTNFGVPIEGATFYRTDSTGNTYGESVSSDVDGNAVLENIPYSSTGNVIVYFIQNSSDGEHTFSTEVKSVTMNQENVSYELENPDATKRSFTLNDANYEGLVINDGTIYLNEQ